MNSSRVTTAVEPFDEKRCATVEEIEENLYLTDAIKAYQKKKHITQTQLGENLRPKKRSQPYISRRLSPPEKPLSCDLLSFCEARLYCEAMGTSLANVLQEYDLEIAGKASNNQRVSAIIPEDDEFIQDTIPQEFHTDIFSPDDNLTNNIHDPMFKCWFGTYHCYFFSTLSTENRCFHGIMTIPEKSDNGCCNVGFDFVYDETTKRHKKYYGQLILSKKTDGAYCTLINSNDQGEISYLLMSNPSIKNKPICCVLALVLTISGGKDTHHPCAERMILSREELGGKNFELAKAHLLLNDKYIRIMEDDFKLFLENEGIPDSFKKLFQKCEHPFDNYKLSEYACRMATIPEAWIKSLPGYTEQEHQMLIDLMRLYSISPKFNKIRQKTAENDIFEMFKDLFSKWNLSTN